MPGKMKCMAGNSQPKDFSGKDKAKFRGKESFDYVVIDDDDDDDGGGDQLDDVVVIDAEFPEGNLNDSVNFKVGERYPFEGVINIEDDDEYDSDGNPGVQRNTKPYGNTSSSQRRSASNFMWRSVGFDDDDCQVIHEKKSVFGLSKCRQAERHKPSYDKVYGFIPESMSSSSSDCEVIEAENVPPELEKTLKRRKFNANSSPIDQEDHKGASATHSDKPPDIQARSRTEDWGEGPVCSSPEDSTFSETCSSASPETNENNFYKDEVSCTSSHKDTSYGQPFSREAKDSIFESILGRKHFGAACEHLYGDGTIHSQTETIMDREKFKETEEYKQAAETEWESRKLVLQLQAEEAQRLREIRKAEREKLERRRDKKDNDITDEELHGSEAVYNGNPEVMETPLDSIGGTKRCGPSSHHSVRYDKSESIIGREKLKESEEYKKAMEAEWMARQQQIVLQAQTAQRLRRKKQAEKRILDMERRQKGRVEEMREIEKKEKENMDLKEQLRIEIRKNLSNLESACSDMASLLRGLGVFVAEGSNSSSPEVHAAYKRALLKFHPDRASRSDIRQQVEAEEKFKLISRMKDKYLSA